MTYLHIAGDELLEWLNEAAYWREQQRRLPMDPLILYNNGLTELHAGNISAAHRAFSHLIVVDDLEGMFRTFALGHRGYCNLEMGDLNGAAQDLTSALKSEPNNPYYRLQRGVVYLRTGNIDAAAADFRHAISMPIPPEPGETGR